MRPLDGRAAAAALREETTAMAAELAARGVPPTLAVLLPTDDGASAAYVRSIERAAAKVGVRCVVEQLARPGRADVERRLAELSADPEVHGVLCQTPLPEGVRLEDVAGLIDPAKDVDGANPTSFGRLSSGLPAFAPATAAAVLELLRQEKVELTGRRVVVVGRSLVVGKPVAMLLLAENATVTVCHSRSVDLPGICREADVLVVAVGRAEMVGADYLKDGAVVVDVGINVTADGRLVGDVDAAAVQARASALAPVPGGVGPVTTALLLRHTVLAAADAVAR